MTINAISHTQSTHGEVLSPHNTILTIITFYYWSGYT